MFDFNEKRVLREILYSKLSVSIVIVITLLMLKGVWGAYWDQKSTKENLIEAQNELAELKERQGLISSDIENLKTTEGQEQEIRSKFQVVKEGEKMIMVVDAEGEDKKTEQDTGFWGKIKAFFGLNSKF